MDEQRDINPSLAMVQCKAISIRQDCARGLDRHRFAVHALEWRIASIEGDQYSIGALPFAASILVGRGG